jgi:hypothetical protein
MPDISMCKGTNCPLRDNCYRYTATPSEFRQSWFTTPPVKSDNTCAWYWKDKEIT